MRRTLAAALVAAVAVLAAGAAPAPDLTVFAASSLTDALGEVVATYHPADGTRVRLSFAASSTLARQIESGASANLFISADEEWVDYLARRGLVVGGSRTTLLGNRLVLVTPGDRHVTVTLSRGFDLAGLLGAGRLATGDPAHVPVGRYAKEALENLGVWAQAEHRLVPADSVRAALALVERGEVPAGIVYATDAKVTPRVRVAAVFPESTHAPIVYPMVVVAGQDSAGTRALYAFLRSAPALAVFRRYGFSTP